MNDRQYLALTDPLDGSDRTATRRHSFVSMAGDGCRVATVLAVDR